MSFIRAFWASCMLLLAAAILPTTAAHAQTTVTSVSPNSGSTAGGTTVVITGNGFSGVTAVVFGSSGAASYTVDSATQITAVTSAHAAGPVTVSVSSTFGTGSLNNAFTYITPAPTITSVSPNSDVIAGGTLVSINGTNLLGATAVTFGGTSATNITVVSATQIRANVPAHSAGAVDVAVTTPGGTATASNAFTYYAPPRSPL